MTYGKVTITTVSEMLRWVLSSITIPFCKRYPALRLRVLASAQVSSLAAGEADIALRLGRPDRGDPVARDLAGALWIFVSPAGALGSSMPWLGLTGALAHN
ncbi:MAG: LysR substrate-binding domain-containing protein [Polyangiaceae bacterium]